MSIIDDAVAALTPMETAEDRAEARAQAQAGAAPGSWFAEILGHHIQLEQAFAGARAPEDAAARKWLGVMLTGHAIAEESVIYPAMAETGDRSHADHGYDEQAMVKREMAALEKLSGDDYLEKLESIREAVAHHMYEEEGTWMPELQANANADQDMLTRRYKEEFSRYIGNDKAAFAF